MKKIYTADSMVDGQLLVDYLRGYDIPAELFHQNAVGGLGDLPVTYPEVWIKRNFDLERAALLVKQFISTPTNFSSWVCATCDETNPGSFEICWQCRSRSSNTVD